MKPAVNLTAKDVERALGVRWPAAEYLTIREAPLDASRQGRKLDLLVIGLWQSRGNERDGVEIKVSMADWLRELKAGAKADRWWGKVHRFWLAAPAGLAEQVKAASPWPDGPGLPDGWGLLAVGDDRTRVLAKPERREPESFSWLEQVGLMRASADAGVRALGSARAEGYEQGLREGKAQAERRGGDPRYGPLRAAVDAFEEASGIEIGSWSNHRTAAEMGRAVAALTAWDSRPEAAERALRNMDVAAKQIQRMVADLSPHVDALQGGDER